MRKKVTTVTVEKERIIEIRWQGQRRESRCEQCRAEVRTLTPGEAAILAGVSSRMVYSWVEAGRLHFTTTQEGLPLVCLNSLAGLPDGGLVTDRRIIESEGGRE